MNFIPGSSWRPAAVALSAATLALLAACSSGGSNSATGTGTANTGSGGSQTAKAALLTAATQSQQINSAVTTLHVKVTGSQASTETGTIQYQLKPSLLMGEDMKIAAEGGNTEIKLIATGTDVYFSEPGLSSKWTQLKLSALTGPSASFAQLVQSMQSNNFTNQTQLFTAAKDAHVVGTATIGGVPTTEYAGSFRASDGLNALSPSVRKILGPQLQKLGNSVISFHEWIDAQHQVRQVVEDETVQGHAVTTTMNVTGINQPVQIAVPAASEITTPGQ
jgi:hypothetical protein